MSPTEHDPLAADASVHLLADHLLAALLADEIEPSLLHVRTADDGGSELGLLPLDGDHPSDFLIGLAPPDDWDALGFMTRGWVYDSCERSRTDRHHTRVAIVAIGTRTGELAHRTHCDDPDLDAKLDEELPAGEQVDLIRRCFGLPTDPAPTGAATFWCIEWLGRILSTEPAPCDWDDVLDLHPAMELLATSGTTMDDDSFDIVTAFHRVCNWSRLRALAATGSWPAPDLSAREASWLDEGSFARWILNRCPSLHDLRSQAIEHLEPHVAAMLRQFLDDAGIPERAWPEHRSQDCAA